MNSNELNPNHKLQIAISIIAFVILLVGAAWIYSRSSTNFVNNEKVLTESEILAERSQKKVILTQEEQVILSKRVKSKVILTPNDKKILEARFMNKN
jgi:hypothetical protein